MTVFWFSAAWGARKCRLTKYILLLLEKLIFKNPCCFLYLLEHTILVLILKIITVPCRTFRGIPLLNVDLTCAQCGNLYTVYNGIFSATLRLSCLLFQSVYMKFVWLFCQRKNLCIRACIGSDIADVHCVIFFKNEIPLKVRQATVLSLSINTIFACSKR